MSTLGTSTIAMSRRGFLSLHAILPAFGFSQLRELTAVLSLGFVAQVATVGVGFLGEALRNRKGPQCAPETCPGLCYAEIPWSTVPAAVIDGLRPVEPAPAGLKVLHGGDPP